MICDKCGKKIKKSESKLKIICKECQEQEDKALASFGR